MSTETDVADLLIPPAAVEAYFVCGCSESGVRAGYRPEALGVVVAAELRRLADEMADDAARIKRSLPADHADYVHLDRIDQGRVFAYEDEVRALRARADQLDSAGG